MLTAITHKISPRISECELTFLERTSIDLDVAESQHEGYCATLEDLGVSVIRLDGNDDYPDSVFVEDTAVVVDEIAVICRPGAPSRRGETGLIERELAKYRETVRIPAPATIDGGDVLRIGKRVFVGLSRRTNAKGIEELDRILSPHGYHVTGIETAASLHLKSACTAINDETLIVNPAWLATECLKGFKFIHTARGEDAAANVLRIGSTVCVQAGFPRAAEMIEALGEKVRIIDTSELGKAEAGLTCSSIVFDANH